MPKQSFALEPGSTHRLEIQWKGLYKDTTLTLDGVQLGPVLDQGLLRAGQELPLPDGSLLKLHLVSNLAGTELRVTRNGIPLPGSASNPETKVGTAAGIIFFVAGLNLLLGVISLLTRSEFLASLGIGWFSIIFGAFFLVMGFLVKKRSMVALILSIVVFSLDALVGVIGSIAMGGAPAIGGLVFRVFLIIPMVQGVGAITALKKPSAPPSVPPVV
ncbi:MAG: hypothetical protein CVU42_04830 [Chloroflexi bacterium HGW-Chloroflexi-4]|jgi:hypothetical protein|nr:MAG: hypothetical protein CVU42_04830 [Chloroflexi bacterium HGW-Chloroflexi-4]